MLPTFSTSYSQAVLQPPGLFCATRLHVEDGLRFISAKHFSDFGWKALARDKTLNKFVKSQGVGTGGTKGERRSVVEFRLPQLFAVSKCPCGTCRTVGLEPVELPNWRGESGHLGGITIETKDHGPIDILLHANKGFLVEMEVIWYYFPKPFPKSLVEVSRKVDLLH